MGTHHDQRSSASFSTFSPEYVCWNLDDSNSDSLFRFQTILDSDSLKGDRVIYLFFIPFFKWSTFLFVLDHCELVLHVCIAGRFIYFHSFLFLLWCVFLSVFSCVFGCSSNKEIKVFLSIHTYILGCHYFCYRSQLKLRHNLTH